MASLASGAMRQMGGVGMLPGAVVGVGGLVGALTIGPGAMSAAAAPTHDGERRRTHVRDGA